VPQVPATELERAAGGCSLCAERPGDRLVAAGDGWQAWVPIASAWPYGLVVAPIDHAPDLPSLDASSRDGLATVLVDVLARLDRLFDAPMPYMLWFHQRPTDGGAWPAAHLHAEISPLLRARGVKRYMAGAELGGGMLINPVVPEEAAAALRDA
jgi:UDPglucose--hexose-1-phosphate uridylyltransferase